MGLGAYKGGHWFFVPSCAGILDPDAKLGTSAGHERRIKTGQSFWCSGSFSCHFLASLVVEFLSSFLAQPVQNKLSPVAGKEREWGRGREIVCFYVRVRVRDRDRVRVRVRYLALPLEV